MRLRSTPARKSRGAGDLPCLPQVTAFVSRDDGEAGAEWNTQPRSGGRADACAREIDAVGLSQSIDVLHLIRAECREDLASRSARARIDLRPRLQTPPDRRLVEAHVQASEPVVSEGALAVEAAPDGVGNPFVERGKIRACGCIQMLEALSDRPRRRRRSPYKLIVGERTAQCDGVGRNLFELAAKLVDLRG